MPTADYEWIIRAQGSRVEGFKGQFFGEAAKGIKGHRAGPDGNQITEAEVRLFTPWQKSKEAALHEIEGMVSKYESGVP